jgi:hypothetical protein
MQVVEFYPPNEKVSFALTEPVPSPTNRSLFIENSLESKLDHMIRVLSKVSSSKSEEMINEGKRSYSEDQRRLEIESRALEMIQSGYTNYLIASRLNIKPTQVAWIKRKIKHLHQTRSGRGRPPIIQRRYLEFIESHLSNKE